MFKYVEIFVKGDRNKSYVEERKSSLRCLSFSNSSLFMSSMGFCFSLGKGRKPETVLVLSLVAMGVDKICRVKGSCHG